MSAATAEKVEKTPAEKFRDGELLTLDEAAPFLGQKTHWGVRKLIDNWGLPFVRIGKRGKKIDPQHLREWKEKRKEVITF